MFLYFYIFIFLYFSMFIFLYFYIFIFLYFWIFVFLNFCKFLYFIYLLYSYSLGNVAASVGPQPILEASWWSDAFPEQCTDGIIVKIPKKGNLKIIVDSEPPPLFMTYQYFPRVVTRLRTGAALGFKPTDIDV